MAKTLNFVCIMILFLSIFLLSKEAGACETLKDCPESSHKHDFMFKCINNECVPILNWSFYEYNT
ncbi:unnamed protein product [Lathyrus oleraceus]